MTSNRSYNLTARALLLSCLTALAAVPEVNAADILVGPARNIKTLAAGVATARSGDRILLDAGTYTDDVANVAVPVTIEGQGAGAVLRVTQPIANRKGILVVDATTTVRNVTFQGAYVTDNDGGNGAGIRMQRGDLIVDNCTFIENQNGMLVNPISGATITVQNSRFVGNGSGSGYTHAIYVNEVAQFTVKNGTFDGTVVGHSIKSRALKTTIANTVIDDGVAGTSSYGIDLPNGGVAVLDGVQITQGPNTQNPAMVAYGAEGNLKPANSLTIANSTFINKLISPSAVAINNFTTTVLAVLIEDTFQGNAVTLKGPGGGSTAAQGPVVRQASVFSTAQATSQSHLRFYNSGSTTGTVKVTLFDGATGSSLAVWQSGDIAPNAAPQISIATIEAAARQPFARPAYYAVGIQPNFSGSFQHVLYRPADGTLTNLTACDTGIGSSGAKLANAHSSLLSSDWPSSIVVYNTGLAVSAVTLGIFDARDGTRLGTYTSPVLQPGGQASLSVDSIEAGANIKPTTGMSHYTMRVEGAFTGVLQQLVSNERVGVVTDMTAVCALGGS